MLIRELDWREPVLAARAWADDPVYALLESGGARDSRGRYSYLGVDPFAVLAQTGDIVTLDGVPQDAPLLDRLQAMLARWHAPPAAPVPFAGGAIGFIGYDLARQIGDRRIAAPLPDRLQALFGFYDVVLAFDHVEERCWVLSSGLPAEVGERSPHAARRLDRVLERLGRAPVSHPAIAAPSLGWLCALTLPDYMARVARVIEHIRAGDIYQANFTTRHTAPRPEELSAADFYAILRARSPAPFGGLLAAGAIQLASVSPERFIRLDPAGALETRPIKGTRPRGRTPDEDTALAHELSHSIKDRAENLMIVDLLRNDLGRVATVGSVHVPSLCALESFASVHHLVSAVQAQLRPGLGPVDVLRATLPGGSITGAPKIRAMEIIDAVEGSPRGPYCGIIGWIGFDGAMDTNIAIRTVTLLPDRLEAQAGGGIVADSDPAEEYEEMLVKVRPLLVGRS